MSTSALMLVAFPLFFGTLVLIGWKLSSGLTDVVTLFTLVFGLFYGFRSLILVAHLDTPYPDRFFDLNTAGDLAGVTLLWLTAFLVCFAVGVVVMTRWAMPPGTLFFARQAPSSRRMLTATAVLTAVATVISLLLTARYGGVGGFVHAVKVQKELTGLYFLKVPASIGAVVSFATFLQIRNQAVDRVPRALLAVVFIAGVLDGFWVFIWGQRSTLVVLGVILLLGWQERGGKRPRAGVVVARLLVAAVIVVAVSTGLRVARDSLLGGGRVADAVATSNEYRKASIATNSIYFDSSMLAFRDWPDTYAYRGGQDFVNGAAGFVPRAVWHGKPANVTIGREFRQIYQPQVVNGWPVGAPTLWWLNFGPLGVLIGGLVSGLGFGWISMAQRRSQRSGLNIAIAIVTAVYVFQTGIGSEWPVYFSIWLAPLWVVSAFVSRGGTGRRADSTAPAAAADVAVPASSGAGSG